jgi:hypothetical protein
MMCMLWTCTSDYVCARSIGLFSYLRGHDIIVIASVLCCHFAQPVWYFLPRSSPPAHARRKYYSEQPDAVRSPMSFRALTWPHRAQLALLQVGLRCSPRCARRSCSQGQPMLHAATAGVPGSVQTTRKHDTTIDLGSTLAPQNVGSTAVWSGLPAWRGLQVDTRRRWGRLQCEEVRRGW